jgi:hypothetical protein
MSILPMTFGEIRRVVDLVGTRELQPRDAAVFIVLTNHTDPMTSKVQIGAEEVGELIGMQTPHVVASIKRLVTGGVLKRTYSERTGVHTLHLADDKVKPRQRRAVVERWLAEREAAVEDDYDDEPYEP